MKWTTADQEAMEAIIAYRNANNIGENGLTHTGFTSEPQTDYTNEDLYWSAENAGSASLLGTDGDDTPESNAKGYATVLSIETDLYNDIYVMIYSDGSNGDGHLTNFENATEMAFGIQYNTSWTTDDSDPIQLIMDFTSPVDDSVSFTEIPVTASTTIANALTDYVNNNAVVIAAKANVTSVETADAEALSQVEANNTTAQEALDAAHQSEDTALSNSLASNLQTIANNLSTSQAQLLSEHQAALKAIQTAESTKSTQIDDDLATQLATIQSNYNSTIAQIASEYSQAYNDLVASDKAQLAQMVEDDQTALAALKTADAKDLQALIDTDTNALDEKKTADAQTLADLVSTDASDLDTLKSTDAAKLASLVSTDNAALTAQKNQDTAALVELKAEIEAPLKAMIADHTTSLAELAQTQATALAALKAELDAQIDDMKSSDAEALAELKAENQAAYDEAKAESDAYLASIKPVSSSTGSSTTGSNSSTGSSKTGSSSASSTSTASSNSVKTSPIYSRYNDQTGKVEYFHYVYSANGKRTLVLDPNYVPTAPIYDAKAQRLSINENFDSTSLTSKKTDLLNKAVKTDSLNSDNSKTLPQTDASSAKSESINHFLETAGLSLMMAFAGSYVLDRKRKQE